MINPKTIKQQIQELREDIKHKPDLIDVVDNIDGTFSLKLYKDGELKVVKIKLPTGKDGIDGIDGRDGRDGKDGADGKLIERIVEKIVKPEVIHGRDGSQGIAGKDGKQGKDGKDGKDGSRWYSGVTNPNNKMGKQYDYYLHLTFGDVYEKSKTTWLKKGNIKGPAGGGGGFFSRGGIDSLQAGTNITIDNTNPQSPIISAIGGGGGGGGTVDSVVAGNNIDVDVTDPANPIVSVETLSLADITDITATATEVNYVDGVTSSVQTQIDGKINKAFAIAMAVAL
jgi:hypothetical protein